MGLAHDLFGTDLHSINAQAILKFFSQPRSETSTLEFKSGNTQNKYVARTIAALANTSGGCLIVGAPQMQDDGTGNKVSQTALAPRLGSEYESLLEAVYSLVSPRIMHLEFGVIHVEGGHVIVIDVPMSSLAPHQVDYSYWIRSGPSTKRAEHGTVEALFSRRSTAIIRCEASISWGGQMLGGNRWTTRFSLSVVGPVPAEQPFLEVALYGISQELRDYIYPTSFTRNLGDKFTAFALLDKWNPIMPPRFRQTGELDFVADAITLIRASTFARNSPIVRHWFVFDGSNPGMTELLFAHSDHDGPLEISKVQRLVDFDISHIFSDSI